MLSIARFVPVLATALLLGACASDGSGNLFSTASVAPAASDADAPKSRVSNECIALNNQIEGLRKEGTIGRLEKVAAGKGDNVQVKRTAIAKQAELNKANADFQAKCGPRLPASTQAAAPAASSTTVASAATTATAPPAAAKAALAKSAAPSGVTIAAPSVPKTQ